MAALVLAILLFVGLAALVLHWARRDLETLGTLSSKSAVASWLLYVFHADTVATAAYANALEFELPRAVTLGVGCALIAVGLLIFIAAAVSLVRHGALDGARTTRLVTSGPYRLSRHPQNLGWGVLLLGIAVLGQSVVALALVGLFVAFVERYMRLEDAQLARDFGDAHAGYERTTPTLLALRRRRRASTAAGG